MINSSKLSAVLVVDDEPSVLITFQTILEGLYKVLIAQSGKQALEILAKESIALVFLDIKMPDMDGMQILRKMKEYDENLAVIIATATNCTKKAVQSMQLGACNYITKPFDLDEVVTVAEKAMEQAALINEVTYLRSQRESARFDNIIGKSKKMREVYRIIEKVTKNDATMLICGESGTGKELIARALHFSGLRSKKPFIPINCGSIPDNLLESELFGYEKGAFTGAVGQKLGMFEFANEGTLFLDEISSLKLEMQAKLLRALEEREIKRIGGTKIIKVDVRIISATNTDLKQEIKEGRFRKDLYYRLNVIPLHLPLLKERKEDIPLLVEHFLLIYNKAFRKQIKGFTSEALECLTAYAWPGNIRELKNVIERLVALKDSGIIEAKELPLDIFIECKFANDFQPKGALRTACSDFEEQYINTVLESVNWNKSKAAKILGIHRNGLFNKMINLKMKKGKPEK